MYLKTFKMKTYYNIPNTRAIFVKFLPMTNCRGERIKFSENYRSGETKIVSFTWKTGTVIEQAFQYLVQSGFDVVGRATTKDNYIFFVNNWGENFIKIKDLITTKELKYKK